LALKNLIYSVIFSGLILLPTGMLNSAELSNQLFSDKKGNNKDAGFQNIKASADSLERLGTNIIASGNVLVLYKNYRIKADKAIVNPSSKDIEAVGNVEIVERSESEESVTLKRYRELLKDS